MNLWNSLAQAKLFHRVHTKTAHSLNSLDNIINLFNIKMRARIYKGVNMRIFVISMIFALSATAALAQSVQRNGYMRKDGTYVAPSYSTRSNNTVLDNYSTRGNVNPYSGRQGYVDPYAAKTNGNPFGNSNGYTHGTRKSKSPY